MLLALLTQPPQASRPSWSPSPAIHTCRPGGRRATCWAGSTPSPTRAGTWGPRSPRAPIPPRRSPTACRCSACWTPSSAAPPMTRAGPTYPRSREPVMPRPFTLSTGQWADLPLEEICAHVREWGYDGLELACWGDHFDVQRALTEDGYLA